MSNKYDFCHLHRHCEGSIQDGAGKVEDGVKYAAEMGHKGVAVTDHGNLISYIRFYNQAKESGIKHVFGLEAYLCEDMNIKDKDHKDYNHCTILVKNEQGFKNILKLNNMAQEYGFYYRPRIDWDTLFKHKEGLIIFSGCVIGKTCQLILNGRTNEAMSWNRMMKKEIGSDYYIETMLSDFSEQAKCNVELLNISKTLDIPTVITGDAHYTKPEDYKAQQAMMLLASKATIHDLEEQERKKAIRIAGGEIESQEEKDRIWVFSSNQYWMKNETEMENAWDKWHKSYYPKEEFEKGMNQSGLIVDTVEDVSLDVSQKMPKADLPDGVDHKKYFEDLLNEKMKEKNLTGNEVYEKRLEFELSIINKKNLVDYFLVNYDIIGWCKRNNIFVGPGRGSAGGALVCYLLNITEIDPLKFDLLFERFLDIGRKEMPDIDTDFEIDERDRVKQYISDRYGKENFASICALGTFRARNIVRDIMRVYGHEPDEMNIISKLIPEDAVFIDGDIMVGNDPYKQPVLDKFFEDNPEVKGIASTLFGQIRHISKHAAGIVITNKPLDETIATIRSGDEIMTAWTEGLYRKELSQLNVLKLDILGLKTLSMLKKACELAGFHYKDLLNTDENDTMVYQKIGEAELMKGIFQFDSNTGTWLFKHMKPQCFADVVALAALDRPGPLDSGMAFEYIDIMHNIIPTPVYDHPAINEVLKETHGVIVYQEQLMLLSQKLSGFDSAESSSLRKNLVKGAHSKEAIIKEKKERETLMNKFIDGAIANNCKRDVAEKLWETMVKFARYGFNKAHSVGYAYVSFWTMWMKIYHPTEFYAALLSYAGEDDIPEIIDEMRRLGIEIQYPDINTSGYDFTPDKDKFRILFGLGKIKYLGINAQNDIMKLRPFTSFQDFCDRVEKKNCNKRGKEALIRSGCFDSINPDRADLFRQLAMLSAKKNEVVEKEVYTIEQKLVDEQKFLSVIISEIIPIRKRTASIEHDYKRYKLESSKLNDPELYARMEKNAGEWQDPKSGIWYERFSGWITSLESLTSKSGNEMLRFAMITHEGNKEAFFIMKWDSFYGQLSKLREGAPISLAIFKRANKKEFPKLTHLKELT